MSHTKKCSHCQQEFPPEEFASKFGKAKYYLCLECRRKYAKKLMRQRRKFEPIYVRSHIVRTMGGACSRCGYHEFESSIEFHHVDRHQKDSSIGRLIDQFCYGATETQWQALLHELNKCILLCSNCHQALHNNAIHKIPVTKTPYTYIPMPTQE